MERGEWGAVWAVCRSAVARSGHQLLRLLPLLLACPNPQVLHYQYRLSSRKRTFWDCFRDMDLRVPSLWTQCSLIIDRMSVVRRFSLGLNLCITASLLRQQFGCYTCGDMWEYGSWALKVPFVTSHI